MSLTAPIEVGWFHGKLINQILDVCQLNDAKDVKNILRVMLPKCHTMSHNTHTHTHTHTHTQHGERTIINLIYYLW
jgi:hypothetical protein